MDPRTRELLEQDRTAIDETVRNERKREIEMMVQSGMVDQREIEIADRIRETIQSGTFETIPENTRINEELASFGSAVTELVDSDMLKSLTERDKDELRELSKELAKDPKNIEKIRLWVNKRRNR